MVKKTKKKGESKIKSKIESEGKPKFNLFKFFKKLKRKVSKKNVSDELIDELSEEQDQFDDDSRENPANTSITIDIDRIKAHEEALDQARKITSERFIRVAEEMGEYRSYVLGLEKELRDVMVNVAKSVDLVNAVQPQKLMSMVEKQNVLVETNKIKISSNREMSQKVLDELKEVRKKMKLFRGVEQIMKILEETKEKAIEVEKLKTIVEKHTDKISNMFVNVKKQFDDFKNFKVLGKEVKTSMTNLTSEFEKVKSKVETEVTSDDLDSIREDNSNANELVMNMVNELKEELSKQGTLFTSTNKGGLIFKLNQLKKNIDENKKENKTLKKQLAQNNKEIAKLKKQIKAKK